MVSGRDELTDKDRAAAKEIGRLDLGGRGLEKVPAEVFWLTTLRELDLSGNRLTSLPPVIKRLTGLNYLSLDSNQLVVLPPELGALAHLVSLDLGHNNLQVLPAEFSGLQRLRSLTLTGNQLAVLPAAIGALRHLETLRLDDNRLVSVPPEIGQLTSLTRLQLKDNQLTSLPSEIRNLVNLRSLRLDRNRLTVLPPGLAELGQLQELRLDGNEIFSALPAVARPPGQGQALVSQIVSALAAGAVAASRDDAEEPVRARLSVLRELIRGRLSDRPAGERVLAQYEQAPDIFRYPLEYELTRSGAATDVELLAAARALAELLPDDLGSAAAKYNVTISNSSGVQVGDGDVQANTFGGVSVGRDVYYSGGDMTITRSGGGGARREAGSDHGTGSGPGSGHAGGSERGNGGGGVGEHPAEDDPPARFLTGSLPERAPAGARITLLAQVTLAARGSSAAMKAFPVSRSGAVVTITVAAPGLLPLGDLEGDLTVPFAQDSDPVRFGFHTGPPGLHSVQVRAFAGGTCLGELTLEISVEAGATLEQGRPRTAPLTDLAAEPGEVTLQVSRTASGGYSFQLLSGALYPAVVIDRLAREPGEVIGQMIAELRGMSKSTAQYRDASLARRRLRSLGSQLWGDVVPAAIQEQFWAQRDKIRLFTIASDMDTVPWELLYPVDSSHDSDKFLVEQFPVVRRVYGQDRARVLRLDKGTAFIVPPRPPANVLDEVAAVRSAFPASVPDRGILTGLAPVLEVLETDAVPSVLHLAGHNTFTEETGSLISLDGGPLRPSDLSYARQRRSFEPDSPLVFLNGCRTAGEVAGFTHMIGWAKEFMGAGAGAFIGTLWAVRSTAARTFAEEFYRALVHDRKSLGDASLQARQAIAADEGDPTWLAYTVYGNPAASVTYDPATP
jgi:hypothetical protein